MSDVVSDTTQSEFLSAVPQAQHVDVAGLSHMAAGGQNDAFAKAMIDFSGCANLRLACDHD
jgi:hypothetical protein